MNVRRNLRVRDIRGLIESRLWAQILVAMVVGVGVGLLLSPQTEGLLDGYAAGINLWCAEAHDRCAPSIAPALGLWPPSTHTIRSPVSGEAGRR